jgi:single-strand DNA-binding protein
MNLNKVHLIGRLGGDPVMRTTQSGTKVANISIATQDFIKNKNESETTWHRVVIWGKSAEFCGQYLKKGDAVYIDGTMKVRKFETSEGKMNYIHEIHSLKVQRLGYRRDKNQNEQAEHSINELDEQHLQS